MLSEVNEIEQLSQLDAQPWSSEAFCAKVAEIFQVKPSEVALLELRGQLLSFLFPPELRAAGAIPVSSSAVAARSAQSQKAELFNRFAEVNHFSIFELVKMDDGGGLDRQIIQKLMSAPILTPQGQVLGVIQVSRKASRPAIAGPDFTPADLENLKSIADLLAKLLAKAKALPQTASQT